LTNETIKGLSFIFVASVEFLSIDSLRLSVFVEGTISHGLLGHQVVLLENFLNAGVGSSTNRKPVLDSLLGKRDMTGERLSLSEGPHSHFLKVSTVELSFRWLHNNPPVRGILATVVLQLKFDSHILMAIFNK
jgi:hypothetical protein